jgi:hypothetical protein
MRALVGYPRVGQRVRVVGRWRDKEYDLIGVVMPSRNDPRSPAWRAWGGAILAHVRDDNGICHVIPWSRRYVTFYEA